MVANPSHFGVHFPAGQQRSSNIADYAKLVDETGFDSVWLIENLGSGSPGLECLTTLGYLAACAPRLTIGTSVMLLPLRNPVIVAQAAATLEVLTGGKFILGVGVGGGAHHTALGADARTRGRRCEESLELMRRLWTETDVRYHGEFNEIDGYTLGPRPSKPPPVWVGGHSDVTIQRAARHADGYIPVGATADECRDIFERLDRYSADAGRAGKLTRAVHAFIGFEESPERAMTVASEVLSARYGSKVKVSNPAPHLLGQPEDCLRTMRAFEAIGVTHFVFDPVCRPEATEAQVERLMREIVDPFRSG